MRFPVVSALTLWEQRSRDFTRTEPRLYRADPGGCGYREERGAGCGELHTLRREHEQRRLGELSAGAHPGVSTAGLRPQQNREDSGAGSEQRGQNGYGIRLMAGLRIKNVTGLIM